MSEVTNTSTLREALERIAQGHDFGGPYTAQAAQDIARDALTALEPEWEYRAAAWDEGCPEPADASGAFAAHADAEAALGRLLDAEPPYDYGHIERRTPAGSWERTESHEEKR